jgi:hypothetical protein
MPEKPGPGARGPDCSARSAAWSAALARRIFIPVGGLLLAIGDSLEEKGAGFGGALANGEVLTSGEGCVGIALLARNVKGGDSSAPWVARRKPSGAL